MANSIEERVAQHYAHGTLERSILTALRDVGKDPDHKARGVFGIYDVMQESEGELSFPVLWASSAETSFVESAAVYRGLLDAAGFEVRKQRSRREFAIEFFRVMRARTVESGGLPPLGLQILMGPASPRKVENMIANLEHGLIAPTEIIGLVK